MAASRIAAVQVVVHEPHRLHERVDRRRADEPQPRFFRSFASAFDSGVCDISKSTSQVSRFGRLESSGSKRQIGGE